MNTHLGQNFLRSKWGVSRLNGLTEQRRCMSMVQELLDALRDGCVYKKDVKSDHEKSNVARKLKPADFARIEFGKK